MLPCAFLPHSENTLSTLLRRTFRFFPAPPTTLLSPLSGSSPKSGLGHTFMMPSPCEPRPSYLTAPPFFISSFPPGCQRKGSADDSTAKPVFDASFIRFSLRLPPCKQERGVEVQSRSSFLHFSPRPLPLPPLICEENECVFLRCPPQQD